MNDDSHWMLPLETLPRRVRDQALKLYLDHRKSGEPVPAPLQAYIDWGIERQLIGETPYPASKDGKQNPVEIYISVYSLMRQKGWCEKRAIPEVAQHHGLTVRQVQNKLKAVNGGLIGFAYYVWEVT